MKSIGWAAIRLTDGREWIDTNSIGLLEEIVRQYVEHIGKTVPIWSKSNPVQRIVMVEIREGEDSK